MIYVFGNSHAHAFTGSHPSTAGLGEISNTFFKSYSLGPVIAYNFHINHYERLISIINSIDFNKNNDAIMLIVGEVDCRWHLPFHAHNTNKHINDVVFECVERYFINYNNLINSGYKMIGWGGHPSTTGSHDENPSNPVFGDCITRNKISLLWDFLMEAKCANVNIPYISIIKDLINEDGLTKMEYFDDYCHLNHNKIQPLINEKFKTLIS